MPRKTKIVVKVTKPKKQKLSPAERSQIAKDRWAKIKADKAKTPALPPGHVTKGDVMDDLGLQEPIPAPLVAEQDTTQTPSELEVSGIRVQIESDGGKTITTPIASIYRQNLDGSFTEIVGGVDVGQGTPVAPTVEPPAPQLAPAKTPKPKRYTGPKEFSVALKAAEGRLAKAINERAEAMGKLAGLNAEIPSLLQIINALKGPTNVPSVPYDFSGSVPNATGFQNPLPQFQPPVDPMDAIRAAMAAPPVSRAVGNAVQLPPDVVGTLEGPDDDDPDKFITGPYAGGGFIGG